MENLETLEHFENTIALYQKLFRIEPEIIAYDLHPEYLSTKYALELGSRSRHLKLVPVQHHHAHIVSCLTDNKVKSQVIGVALDGTGYGKDGHIWGGEFLVADYKGFHRMGHLEYLPLPGGALAIRKPYRTAVGYLVSLLGEGWFDSKLAFLREVDPVEIELIRQQIETGLNSPLTSSMGRLFDAISALLGIRDVIDYEGQAAIELEMVAYEDDETVRHQNYPFSITGHDGVNILQLKELLSAVVEDLYQGIPVATISARFHSTVAQMICQMCQLIAESTGIDQVALSGGVFQNRLLLRKVIPLLEGAGFTVFTHKQVPCNDGGISLGQAVIASFA